MSEQANEQTTDGREPRIHRSVEPWSNGCRDRARKPGQNHQIPRRVCEWVCG